MATITEIRINGQDGKNNIAPVIAGLNPVITWEFDQDIATPSQVLYEILIGTENTNWGFNAFSGNIEYATLKNTANVHEYNKHNLDRGNLYYGQIRVKDIDGDFTPWSTFLFKTNKLPSISNCFIRPSQPTSRDDLELYYSYSDPDGHIEIGTKIRWFKNNLPQPSYDDTCVLPKTATNPNESWTAKVIPSDGLEYGNTTESPAVTIQESDLAFKSITILPIDANVDDILKIEYELIENEYTDSIGIPVFGWYVNNLLVNNSNQQYIRLQLQPGDSVSVVVEITEDNNVLFKARSIEKIIRDVSWHIYDLDVSGQKSPNSLTDLEPILEWKIYKTTADADDRPEYIRVLVTKTPSTDSPIYDSGLLEYKKNSFPIPNGVLKRGQKYFIHVGVSDTITINSETFLTTEIATAGSSWSMNVNNTIGWTIETRLQVESTDSDTANLGFYVHDGSYFCAIVFGLRTIKLQSSSVITYEYPVGEPGLNSPKTFRVSAKNNNIRIFMENKLVIDGVGVLNNPSRLKFIEYGDIDTKNTNEGLFRFLRYSTNGAYGLDSDLPDENSFHFSPVGKLPGGEIKYVFENLISWLPDNENESSKIIEFNENSRDIRLPTVTRNYSPITSIFIDEKRNKYIGTANGVTAIYGEQHDPDYVLNISENQLIKPDDFDRISTVPSQYISVVETASGQRVRINTTYESVPAINSGSQISNPNDDDVYNPYIPAQKIHAIHYYSQRTHGHFWFDNVDNEKGWNASFSLDIGRIETDDFIEQNIEKHGFGVYINDGTYQEIVYFYEDRIRLYYANVYIPINTTLERDYSIVGKKNNIQIYQKIHNDTTPSFLLLDGSGLFTTPASKTGNSHKPKLALDSNGIYHAVWHDDSTKRSQIFYSSFTGNEWITPELVAQTNQFNLRNPDIDIDALGRVWVVYEDTSWGPTEIAVSVRDDAGWNNRIRLTNNTSSKARPTVKIDNNQNAHVVWEDNRNGNWNIFWAEWQNDKQAWISSAQFGQESVVMQFDPEDPYFSDEYGSNVVDFKNAKLALLGDMLWIVCETHLTDDNYSLIYRGFRNLSSRTWISSGSIITDDNGDFSSFASGFRTSGTSRYCVNPSIAASELKNTVIIAWEDQTEPIYQIWGSAINASNNVIVGPEKITNQTENCSDPVVGWANSNAVIIFSKNRGLYLSYYNGNLQSFFGSATGGEDRLLEISDSKSAKFPSVATFNPSQGFRLVYEFIKDRDPNTISSIESPEFYMIGDALIEHSGTSFSFSTSTTTLSDGEVSNLDCKEFAFGDFSENVGIDARWSNISLYCGYDAKPFNIVKFNTDTVENWPDNRVNDLFVDTFGNIIAATFGGLVYYNIFNSQITNIQGQTTTFSQINGCTLDTCLLKDKLITSVKWGKNGIWYVGTTQGLFYSRTAGRFWESLFNDILGQKIITDIAVDSQGRAILGAHKKTHEVNDGIFIAHPEMTAPVNIVTPDQKIKCIAIDDSNIIWAGSDTGLFRIENFSSNNILSFDRNQGMRSSHINDIAIVNKHLRYIATATGVERMYGTKFTNFNVYSHGLLNNNISSLEWWAPTNSLWVGSLYSLHEIVFRDPVHDIIENETVHYDDSQISTEVIYDRNIYSVVDFDVVQPDANSDLVFSSENSSIYINKNKLDFGYSINQNGNSIVFLCNLLVDDDVEIELSNKFIIYHDFNQTQIEKTVLGEKRSNIQKIDRTSRNQLLLLSDLDRHSILLDGGTTNLPFTTIMIDRDAPIGCIEKLETVNRNILRFRIFAYDSLSGLDGMILSNYENFTSDGENHQSYQPFSSVVEHDIGNNLTNVITSLEFGDTVEINSTTYSVGSGSALGVWFSNSENKEYLYAGTDSRAIIFRLDPQTDTWSGLDVLDDSDENRSINEIRNINNVLWVSTGSNSPGANGGIYRSTDGETFQLVGSVTGNNVRGIVGAVDGTIYFGSSDGKIYSYKDSILSVKYENIGQSVYSLSLFGTSLVAATGNSGRVYLIDLETNDNIIVFDGSESFIKEVLVKDSDIVTSMNQASLFAVSGVYTTIYRSNLDDFGFSRSFASAGQTIHRITTVDTSVLTQPGENSNISGTSVIAAIGNNLFKHVEPGWEFVYQNDEQIKDIIQYFNNGVSGVWIVSDSKVVKWTAVRNTKTVFLRLKDKAGNISSQPQVGDEYLCPSENASICCNYAYSINIQDLQGFVNESRIVDVTEYGEVVFSYDSPNNRPIYSADRIDQEIGIYTSEVFNGSNDLVSWKSITWESVEPENTSIDVQIRSAVTQDSIEDEDWSANLEKNASGIVNIEHITDQYLQFRVILTSRQRDLSPSLTSVVLRNIAAQASHFFTTNFVLPSRPIKGLLTSNTFIPVSADVVFGINSKNSVDFGDYQIIEPNRLFTTTQSQFGSNLRIGAKLLSPNIPQISPSSNIGDPYDATSYVCNIQFLYNNINGFAVDYHFRIRFYNDRFRTQLIYTFFSGNDQTGWSLGGVENMFPSTGISILSMGSSVITFTPNNLVETNQKWFITIDAYDGNNFETVLDNKSFVCASCNVVNESGLIGQYYGGFATLVELPNFNDFPPRYTVVDSAIIFQPTVENWVTTDGTVLNDDFINRFAVRWRGKILIPSTGIFEFKLVSDDGSLLIIDGEEVINFDGTHTETEKTGSSNLEQGFHDIEIQYFANLGPAYCQVYWILPGETSFSTIPASNYYHSVASEYCDGNEPKILNFALEFELEDGEKVKVNL